MKTEPHSEDAVPICRESYAAIGSGQEGAGLNLFRRRPWTVDYVWLVYSVFFFIQPVQQHTAKAWLHVGIFYGIFLLLYVALLHAHTWRVKTLLFVAFAILAICYMPFDAAALGVFIYIAAFFPFAVNSVPAAFVVALSCALVVGEEGIRHHVSPWSWGIIAFFAVAVGAGNTFMAQAKRNGQKLFRAHQELAEMAKVAERERIARDLHDLLGHTLSVVVLKSELAGRFFDIDQERARTEIGEVETIARQALQQVREAVTGYRSQGLEAEIESAKKALAAAGIKLTCASKPPKLGPTEESVLSLILREAVTNVLRHARATECHLEFTNGPGGAQLIVTDNGCGGIREEGNGLRGMRERVQMLGGSLHIESSRGTKISIRLPVHA